MIRTPWTVRLRWALACLALSAASALVYGILSAQEGGAGPRVIKAESGESAALQAALDEADAGDIVEIPAGDFRFGAAIRSHKCVTLRGQGAGKTVLRQSGDDYIMLGFRCDGLRFEGISLIGPGETAPRRGMGLTLRGRDFLIHGSEFAWFGHAGITVSDRDGTVAQGVIYDNDIHDQVTDFGLGYGVVMGGDGSTCDVPVEPGGLDMVYIEDNRFRNNRHAIDSSDCARWVGRDNEIVCSGRNVSSVGAHGTQGEDDERGSTLWVEIYRNHAHCPEPRWSFAHIRGGNGVIWGNRSDDTDEFAVLALEQNIRKKPFDPEHPAGKTTSLYVWDNLNRGEPGGVSFQSAKDAPLFKEGRDYFLEPRPGYVPAPYPHPARATVEGAKLE